MKKYAAGTLVCFALFFACIRLPAAHAQQGSGSCRVIAVVGQPDPTQAPEDGDSSSPSDTQEPEDEDSSSQSSAQEPEDGGGGSPSRAEEAGDKDSSKPLSADEPGESAVDSMPEDSAATPEPLEGVQDPGAWREPPEGMPGAEDGREPSEEMPDPGDGRKPGGEAGAGPIRQPDPSRGSVSVQEGVSDGTGSGCKCFCLLCLPAVLLMVLCNLILMVVGRKRAAGKEGMRH